MNTRAILRRQFLTRCCGYGAAATGLYPALSLAAELGDARPLPPLPTHQTPKASRLVVIFLTGGMSQLDTFNYLPKLKSDEGKDSSTDQLRAAQPGKLMPTRFKFAQHGQSGLWISEL